MAKNTYGKIGKTIRIIIVALMALWIGGNNFGTSLSTFLIFFS